MSSCVFGYIGASFSGSLFFSITMIVVFSYRLSYNHNMHASNIITSKTIRNHHELRIYSDFSSFYISWAAGFSQIYLFLLKQSE